MEAVLMGTRAIFEFFLFRRIVQATHDFRKARLKNFEGAGSTWSPPEYWFGLYFCAERPDLIGTWSPPDPEASRA
jgi:hypothetical protein